MARKLKSDRVLFLTTLVLLCIGIVMVYSASALVAFQRFDQADLFVTRQVMWSVLGLVVLGVSMRIDYRAFRHDKVIWFVLGLVACLLVMVLFSSPINGTRRWLQPFGLSLQPSELAKIACIFYAALMLERRRERINDLSHSVLPLGIVVGGLAGLIMLQPDFGTAIVLLAIIGVMVYAAGLSYRYLISVSLALVPLLVLVMVSAPYRVQRLLTFLDPGSDPRGAGFQLIQSLLAVGSGGATGRGLMEGVQKLFYLPEPYTDFIYAVIGEELGLVGTTAVLLCFCLVAWRGFRIALRAAEPFGGYLALGLTTMIALQAFVNMSVVLGLVPTKGITLPLISAGGSSLVVTLLAIGVLLNISQHEASDG